MIWKQVIWLLVLSWKVFGQNYYNGELYPENHKNGNIEDLSAKSDFSPEDCDRPTLTEDQFKILLETLYSQRYRHSEEFTLNRGFQYGNIFEELEDELAIAIQLRLNILTILGHLLYDTNLTQDHLDEVKALELLIKSLRNREFFTGKLLPLVKQLKGKNRNEYLVAMFDYLGKVLPVVYKNSARVMKEFLLDQDDEFLNNIAPLSDMVLKEVPLRYQPEDKDYELEPYFRPLFLELQRKDDGKALSSKLLWEMFDTYPYNAYNAHLMEHLMNVHAHLKSKLKIPLNLFEEDMNVPGLLSKVATEVKTPALEVIKRLRDPSNQSLVIHTEPELQVINKYTETLSENPGGVWLNYLSRYELPRDVLYGFYTLFNNKQLLQDAILNLPDPVAAYSDPLQMISDVLKTISSHDRYAPYLPQQIVSAAKSLHLNLKFLLRNNEVNYNYQPEYFLSDLLDLYGHVTNPEFTKVLQDLKREMYVHEGKFPLPIKYGENPRKLLVKILGQILERENIEYIEDLKKLVSKFLTYLDEDGNFKIGNADEWFPDDKDNIIVNNLPVDNKMPREADKTPATDGPHDYPNVHSQETDVLEYFEEFPIKNFDPNTSETFNLSEIRTADGSLEIQAENTTQQAANNSGTDAPISSLEHLLNEAPKFVPQPSDFATETNRLQILNHPDLLQTNLGPYANDFMLPPAQKLPGHLDPVYERYYVNSPYNSGKNNPLYQGIDKNQAYDITNKYYPGKRNITSVPRKSYHGKSREKIPSRLDVPSYDVNLEDYPIHERQNNQFRPNPPLIQANTPNLPSSLHPQQGAFYEEIYLPKEFSDLPVKNIEATETHLPKTGILHYPNEKISRIIKMIQNRFPRLTTTPTSGTKGGVPNLNPTLLDLPSKPISPGMSPQTVYQHPQGSHLNLPLYEKKILPKPGKRYPGMLYELSPGEPNPKYAPNGASHQQTFFAPNVYKQPNGFKPVSKLEGYPIDGENPNEHTMYGAPKVITTYVSRHPNFASKHPEPITHWQADSSSSEPDPNSSISVDDANLSPAFQQPSKGHPKFKHPTVKHYWQDGLSPLGKYKEHPGDSVNPNSYTSVDGPKLPTTFTQFSKRHPKFKHPTIVPVKPQWQTVPGASEESEENPDASIDLDSYTFEDGPNVSPAFIEYSKWHPKLKQPSVAEPHWQTVSGASEESEENPDDSTDPNSYTSVDDPNLSPPYAKRHPKVKHNWQTVLSTSEEFGENVSKDPNSVDLPTRNIQPGKKYWKTDLNAPQPQQNDGTTDPNSYTVEDPNFPSSLQETEGSYVKPVNTKPKEGRVYVETPKKTLNVPKKVPVNPRDSQEPDEDDVEPAPEPVFKPGDPRKIKIVYMPLQNSGNEFSKEFVAYNPDNKQQEYQISPESKLNPNEIPTEDVPLSTDDSRYETSSEDFEKNTEPNLQRRTGKDQPEFPAALGDRYKTLPSDYPGTFTKPIPTLPTTPTDTAGHTVINLPKNSPYWMYPIIINPTSCTVPCETHDHFTRSPIKKPEKVPAKQYSSRPGHFPNKPVTNIPLATKPKNKSPGIMEIENGHSVPFVDEMGYIRPKPTVPKHKLWKVKSVVGQKKIPIEILPGELVEEYPDIDEVEDELSSSESVEKPKNNRQKPKIHYHQVDKRPKVILQNSVRKLVKEMPGGEDYVSISEIVEGNNLPRPLPSNAPKKSKISNKFPNKKDAFQEEPEDSEFLDKPNDSTLHESPLQEYLLTHSIKSSPSKTPIVRPTHKLPDTEEIKNDLDMSEQESSPKKTFRSSKLLIKRPKKMSPPKEVDSKPMESPSGAASLDEPLQDLNNVQSSPKIPLHQPTWEIVSHKSVTTSKLPLKKMNRGQQRKLEQPVQPSTQFPWQGDVTRQPIIKKVSTKPKSHSSIDNEQFISDPISEVPLRNQWQSTESVGSSRKHHHAKTPDQFPSSGETEGEALESIQPNHIQIYPKFPRAKKSNIPSIEMAEQEALDEPIYTQPKYFSWKASLSKTPNTVSFAKKPNDKLPSEEELENEPQSLEGIEEPIHGPKFAWQVTKIPNKVYFKNTKDTLPSTTDPESSEPVVELNYNRPKQFLWQASPSKVTNKTHIKKSKPVTEEVYSDLVPEAIDDSIAWPKSAKLSWHLDSVEKVSSEKPASNSPENQFPSTEETENDRYEDGQNAHVIHLTMSPPNKVYYFSQTSPGKTERIQIPTKTLPADPENYNIAEANTEKDGPDIVSQSEDIPGKEPLNDSTMGHPINHNDLSLDDLGSPDTSYPDTNNKKEQPKTAAKYPVPDDDLIEESSDETEGSSEANQGIPQKISVIKKIPYESAHENVRNFVSELDQHNGGFPVTKPVLIITRNFTEIQPDLIPQYVEGNMHRSVKKDLNTVPMNHTKPKPKKDGFYYVKKYKIPMGFQKIKPQRGGKIISEKDSAGIDLEDQSIDAGEPNGGYDNKKTYSSEESQDLKSKNQEGSSGGQYGSGENEDYIKKFNRLPVNKKPSSVVGWGDDIDENRLMKLITLSPHKVPIVIKHLPSKTPISTVKLISKPTGISSGRIYPQKVITSYSRLPIRRGSYKKETSREDNLEQKWSKDEKFLKDLGYKKIVHNRKVEQDNRAGKKGRESSKTKYKIMPNKYFVKQVKTKHKNEYARKKNVTETARFSHNDYFYDPEE